MLIPLEKLFRGDSVSVPPILLTPKADANDVRSAFPSKPEGQSLSCENSQLWERSVPAKCTEHRYSDMGSSWVDSSSFSSDFDRSCFK